jgi:N-methylhydantoinase A
MGALARSLGLADARAAAAGVVTLADAHMEVALRRVSVESGHDPRGAALVAFGGAGGLHACALAEALGCAAVVFPAHAGVLSALGALAAPPRRERSRTVMLDARDGPGLTRALGALEREVRAAFGRAGRRGLRFERLVQARYAGQSHELPLPAGPRLIERFHREHARRFGFESSDAAIEVVTAEVRGEGPAPRLPPPARTHASTPGGSRTVVEHLGRRIAAVVHPRDALGPGARIAGPAIVADAGATLWVAPGWRARPHHGALLLERRRG